MKLTIIKVDGGPKLLSLDERTKGVIKLKETAVMEEMSIPNKQYFSWRRFIPIDFLNDLISNDIPTETKTTTNIKKT